MQMQKCVPMKQNVMELEVLGGQRIDQKRKKRWWRGRRERIERGNREDRDREKRDKRELRFLLCSRLDSAVKRCSSEVYSPAERLGKGSGPKRLSSEVLIRSEVVGVAKVANN